MRGLVHLSDLSTFEIKPYSRDEFKAIYKDITLKELAIFGENRHELGVLLTFDNEIQIKQALIDTYYDLLIASTNVVCTDLFPKEYINVRSNFLVAGIGQILENWLVDDLSSTSIETTANQILDFLYGDFLNLNQQLN